MKKLTLIIPLLFLLLVIPISVSAYPFLNYGHDALWNETAETGTPAGNGWNSITGVVNYSAARFFNGTRAVNMTGGGQSYILLSKTAGTNYNLTIFFYYPSSSSFAGTTFGYRNSTGLCGTDGLGVCIGSRTVTSSTKFITLINNVWAATPVDLSAGWHVANWDIRGNTYNVTIDGVNSAYGTGVVNSTAYFNMVLATDSGIFFDDMHVWNATIAPTPPNITSNVTYISQSPADITSTNLVGAYSSGANVTYQYFNQGLTQSYVNLTLITNNTCAQFVNGSCRLFNSTPTVSATIIANTTNGNYSNLTFGSYRENVVYPYTENLNFSQIDSGSYTVTLNGANDYISDDIQNLSQNTNINFYEVPVLSTGVVQVYYYNSTYDFSSNPATNPNVHNFCTLISPTSYNHTHNTFGHQFCPYTINASGYLGTVKMSGGGFLIRGNLQGVNVTVANIIARPGVTRETTNGGNTWSNTAGTVASHVHQFSANDLFCHQGYSVIGSTLYNTTRTCDTLDLTPFPPEIPNIYTPNGTRSYTQYLNITWEPAIVNYPGATISGYNITLRDSNLNYVSGIATLSNSSTSYLWNTYNSNLTVGSTYHVAITANDSTGAKSTAFSGNFTVTANGFIIFGTKLYNGSTIANFSVRVRNSTASYDTTASTTNGSLQFDITKGYFYTSTVNPTGYSIANTTINASNASNYYNFTVYKEQTIALRFYDETTNKIVNTTTISVELISDSKSYNYTTTNGTIFAELLTPSAYTIRYGATNYSIRFYSLDIQSQSFNALNLSMCPNTICSPVTIEIKDQFDNNLEGAIIKVLKYDIGINGYYLQEVLTTNFEGKVESNLQINNEYYKFIIEYEGETVQTTQPTYVYGTTLTFVVTIGTSGFEEYFASGTITGTITRPSNTVISFTWNDQDTTATSGCVYAYLESGTGSTLYNSSCINTPSGTTFITLDNSTSGTYTIYGRVVKNAKTYTVDSDIVRFTPLLPTSNGADLFILFMLLLAVVFIGLWNPTVGVVLAGIVPFLLSLTGIINLSVGVTSAVLFMSIVVAYIINR